MAQHFLLSAAVARSARARSCGCRSVAQRMWSCACGDHRPTTKRPFRSCGCQICYDCRRAANQWRWRCKACYTDFSVTPGTLFAWQAAVEDLSDGDHGILQRGERQEHAGALVCWRSPATSRCSTRQPSCWRTNFARPWRPPREHCGLAVRDAQPRSTAPISAGTSGRRTWPSTGSIGGLPTTSRAPVRLSLSCVSAAVARWRRCFPLMRRPSRPSV